MELIQLEDPLSCLVDLASRAYVYLYWFALRVDLSSLNLSEALLPFFCRPGFQSTNLFAPVFSMGKSVLSETVRGPTPCFGRSGLYLPQCPVLSALALDHVGVPAEVIWMPASRSDTGITRKSHFL